MKNTEDIDKLIKETLTVEEAKFYDELNEQNLFGMIGDLFKGKLSWIIVIMNIVSILGVGFFVYCAIQFFNTENTNELIRWGVSGFIIWSFIAMIKLFVWMQMNKNAQMRELKRLELQISILATKKSER